MVHGYVTIGDDCVIHQNCTIGLRRTDKLDDVPVLGAGVEVGPGAVIIGAVHIGDNATVGPKAVILEDLPQGATAFGIPARLCNQQRP